MKEPNTPTRRKDDQRALLEWDSDKKLIDVALAHLAIERAACAVIPAYSQVILMSSGSVPAFLTDSLQLVTLLSSCSHQAMSPLP